MILDTFEIIILSLLIVCFVAQLLFYWIVLAKPYYYMQHNTKAGLQNLTAQPPVSVIIYLNHLKNELSRFLPDILNQKYPEFEVIVVTDFISDADEETLIRMKNLYSNLYSTHVPGDTRNVSRKKLALTLGIKASKYDHLLFTEPDSQIRSDEWISLMARHFSDKKTIVLGFSAIESEESFSHKYIAYDNFISNLQTISFALFNHPYAGDGRNMAYTKNHFIEQRGFVKYRILKQGEDDLFINDIANNENTAIELSPQSIILSETNDLRDWIRQKADRMITKRFYKRGPGAFWRSEIFIRISFFTALIVCLFNRFPYTSVSNLLLPGIALFCFFARFFSQFIVINQIAVNLHLRKFYLTILLYDLFQPFVNSYFFIYLLLKEKENYTYRYEKR